MILYKKDTSLIKRLTARHHLIIELVLKGLTNSQIAERVEMTSAQVRNITKSPIFQHELSLRREALHAKIDESSVKELEHSAGLVIKDAQEKCARRLVDLAGCNDRPISLRACESILDRGGNPRVSKLDSTSRSLVVTLDSDKMNLIMKTLELDSDAA